MGRTEDLRGHPQFRSLTPTMKCYLVWGSLRNLPCLTCALYGPSSCSVDIAVASVGDVGVCSSCLDRDAMFTNEARDGDVGFSDCLSLSANFVTTFLGLREPPKICSRMKHYASADNHGQGCIRCQMKRGERSVLTGNAPRTALSLAGQFKVQVTRAFFRYREANRSIPIPSGNFRIVAAGRLMGGIFPKGDVHRVFPNDGSRRTKA